ncbi:MAG TPA: hypothetical protein VEA16_15840, partial [Vicinamibacterales bacterium]|nr:hypothetical protein [Vicinamibacterales bacterium]
HGNLPRNALRGFGMWQVDLALRRTVRTGDRSRVIVRAELFNALNRANFALPNGNLGTLPAAGALAPNANFGVPSATLQNGVLGLTSVYALGGPRSAQLSIRWEFQ